MASKNQAVGVRVSLVKWHVSVELSSLRSCRWTCEDLVIGSFVHWIFLDNPGSRLVLETWQ